MAPISPYHIPRGFHLFYQDTDKTYREKADKVQSDEDVDILEEPSNPDREWGTGWRSVRLASHRGKTSSITESAYLERTRPPDT